MTVDARRRWYGVLVMALFGALLVAQPATAAPAPVRADPDGDTAALQAKLREVAKNYTDVAARLAASQKRQAQLTAQVKAADTLVTTLVDEINVAAGVAYRTGGMSTVSALLNSASPDEFFDRALSLDLKLRMDDNRLRELHTARQQLADGKVAVDAEVATQQKQAIELAKRKKEAENALASVGGAMTTGLNGSSASAAPAPRNPDGSWPAESCSVKDPTTSGCLTPRTYHAYQQVKAAGFNHYVSCWRSGGSGEHPLGRACDWAAATSGFGGIAYGADKTYGDRLASWLLGNADRLGVLYVIWYRQIWMPGIGWRSYQGDGTPSGDHMNHVHMSIQ